MKALIIALALAGCTNVVKAEEHLGEGAVCNPNGTEDSSSLTCIKNGQAYACIVRGDRVSCAAISVPPTAEAR